MIAPTSDLDHTDVLIVGAGPTGLTLACDLARRGIGFRIVDKATEGFIGSRAKGVQPRTLEVFDDLGVVENILAGGSGYPRMNAHVWFFSLKWTMHKTAALSSDTPYPNIVLIPQWRTEQALAKQLEGLGGRVERDVEVIELAQDERRVVVQFRRDGQVQLASANYVVGADGGRSVIRKQLRVGFSGTTTNEGRMIVGDMQVEGLSRTYWHVWPKAKGGMVGLCPLPNTNLFQLMMQLRASEAEPVLSEAAIQARWLEATGLKHIRLHSPTWLSLFRPNVRMVDKYRVGRVLLAGDAAHVHTPAGAQGLNTGVQDAYNLGWKLALAIKGAPDSLLDTYQEERMPVAAKVLGISTNLYQSKKLKRGDEERQLSLNYRGSSLSTDVGNDAGKVRAGDRAPDGSCESALGVVRLFDLFRGPNFTLLTFGERAASAVRKLRSNSCLRVVTIQSTGVAAAGTYIDSREDIFPAYGVSDEANVIFVVRPDGYVGLTATTGWGDAIIGYLSRIGIQITP